MKNKVRLYIYPLIGIIALGLLMLKPNFFHVLPSTMYQAFEVNTMKEHEFIIWFDIVFLLIMYVFFFLITRRIIHWKRNHLQK